MAPSKADEGKACVDRLRAFQRSNQANKRCANCTERGPTYVCLDFQIFVCQQCSGLHREFGHKIKSISLSEWSLAEVARIEQGGNEKAAAMWLYRYNKEATTNPEPESSDVEAVREFIRAKFVDKKWFRPLSATSEPAKNQAQAAPAPPAAQAAPAPPAAAASSPASGAGGYAAVAPRPLQASQAPMMDLLSGGGSTPVAAAGRPAVAMTDLLDPAPAASTQAWTADFSSNAPKAPPTLSGASAGLIDLDFSAASAPAKASPPMPQEVDTVTAAAAPVAEPAEEPAPTQADDGSASMGEKLRQAVLSGSQDDLKRLFDQCSKPQMKAADPDRVKAFAAFDELFGGGSSAEAQQQDNLLTLEGQAPGAQAADATSWQLPVVNQRQAEPDFGSLLQEMTALGLAASMTPSASSSAPAFPAAAAAPANAATPAVARAAAAAPASAVAPVAGNSSSDVFSPQRLAQLMPQGMAGNLTPGQLEQMSPQDLLQLQMMISSALQARTPQQPAAATTVPSPPPWQTAAALSQHSSGSASDIDWGATDTSAQFGELVDMFQQRKS
eukprot:TRINITY_DN2351_c0_g1_i2.p1 TRINITY_DN2351_c0_g1~~TRINITY_DN2351_c0_g1_i2.p1  ORF type:complete len:556 (+),score=111.99 TRINITY_DN2351_c0_g1_i2:90-1757(+)